MFIAAAVLARAAGSSRWAALHVFLVGGVVLAISGVSLMLTVTWSAAPAPPRRWVATQRALIAVGAAGVVGGRELELSDAVIVASGVAYAAGLVLLALLLVMTVRRGVERRFDTAVAFYVAAVLAGVVGVVLGLVMVADAPSSGRRAAHLALNLLGLVGLVVAGTMPYFAATVGRSRMSPRARPSARRISWGWMTTSLAAAVVALAIDAERIAGVALVGYAIGIVGALWLLPRPTRRQVRWAGPRLVALWAGGVWWAIAVVAFAWGVWSGGVTFDTRWVLVVVIGGYAQILWGSLAYLLPMLRGGGAAHLSDGFAATRSWVGLVAANTTAASLALSLPASISVATLAVWVLDGAWRAGRVGTVRMPRPTEEPT